MIWGTELAKRARYGGKYPLQSGQFQRKRCFGIPFCPANIFSMTMGVAAMGSIAIKEVFTPQRDKSARTYSPAESGRNRASGMDCQPRYARPARTLPAVPPAKR